MCAVVCADGRLRPLVMRLATTLSKVEAFYDSLGGLLGYQTKSLQLICEALREEQCGAWGSIQRSIESSTMHAADTGAAAPIPDNMLFKSTLPAVTIALAHRNELDAWVCF
jgi:hypothetical protein